jgi:hypothetical protein
LQRCLSFARQPGFGSTVGEFPQQLPRFRRGDAFQDLDGPQRLEGLG